MKAGPALALALAAAAGCEGRRNATPDDARCLEHVALGEMTDHSALLWARDETHAFLHARAAGAPHGQVAPFLAHLDRSARLRVSGIAGAGELAVWASDGSDADEPPPVCASRPLHLPPPRGEARPVRFAFGGDIGGRHICHDVSPITSDNVSMQPLAVAVAAVQRRNITWQVSVIPVSNQDLACKR